MLHPAHALLAVLLLAAATTRPATGPTTAASTRPPTAPASKPVEEFVLGHVASLTGVEATFGLSADAGMRLAIEELNAAGGLLGRRVTLVSEDDRSRTEEAEVAARQLIGRHQAVAILGPISSTRTLAVAPVAHEHGVPVLTPTATHPQGDSGPRVHIPRLRSRPGAVRGHGAFCRRDAETAAVCRSPGARQ